LIIGARVSNLFFILVFCFFIGGVSVVPTSLDSVLLHLYDLFWALGGLGDYLSGASSDGLIGIGGGGLERGRDTIVCGFALEEQQVGNLVGFHLVLQTSLPLLYILMRGIPAIEIIHLPQLFLILPPHHLDLSPGEYSTGASIDINDNNFPCLFLLGDVVLPAVDVDSFPEAVEVQSEVLLELNILYFSCFCVVESYHSPFFPQIHVLLPVVDYLAGAVQHYCVAADVRSDGLGLLAG
jgi:hypothetical protein